MIVGNGDIASILPDNEGRCYFASGVSNSKETRVSEFQREKDLLLKQNKALQLVYFGSLCIFYAETEYAKHKKNMEDLVKLAFPSYAIIRLGTITWGKNPHLLINHMRDQFLRGEALDIQDTYRYVIDKHEFFHWVGLIPAWNCEMNITGKKMSIQEIADKYIGHRSI